MRRAHTLVRSPVSSPYTPDQCLYPPGLTTAGNRDIPPLRHEWVWRLAAEFPHLSFELNGGVANLDQAAELLAGPAPEPEPEPLQCLLHSTLPLRAGQLGAGVSVSVSVCLSICLCVCLCLSVCLSLYCF